MWRVPSIICCSVAMTVVSARAGNVGLCEGMAARIRGNPELASGVSPNDPLTALSGGPLPYLEVPREPVLDTVSTIDSNREVFVDRFRTAFGPSEVLDRAVARFSTPAQNEVFSLPESGLHVLVKTTGVVSCRTFLFFQAGAGRPAELAPPVPKSDDPLCYNRSAYLARVAGVGAYLEFSSGLTNFKYALRVVPWQNGKWAEGCSVNADFRSRFRTSRAFVRPGGPLEEATIRDVATQLVERWSDAADPESFQFGTAWPEYMNGRAAEMRRLGVELRTVPVPTFGAPVATLGPFYRELDDPDALPVMLGGQVYLVHVGHATIGRRLFHDSIVIVYALKDGRLSPVASAIVEQDQGALESVRVLIG